MRPRRHAIIDGIADAIATISYLSTDATVRLHQASSTANAHLGFNAAWPG